MNMRMSNEHEGIGGKWKRETNLKKIYSVQRDVVCFAILRKICLDLHMLSTEFVVCLKINTAQTVIVTDII